jgi:hypothetical protein
MKKLLILSLAICGAGLVPANAVDLKESKFTQVVNDVQIVSTTDNSKHPAAIDGVFKMPDVLRTGPASRAELVAEDRTITRVGANTIFSFDQANRSIHLEKGSLLFNSPKGKGGGSIHTAAATAAVIGTTIIVTTTPNGGFKVLTLEGKTEVQYVSGLRQQVQAGEMTFVLPGGAPGPVIMFRLDQQIGGSALVKGFSKTLPSQTKIDAAVTKQVKDIKTGKVADTGLHVGEEATPTGVQVIQLFDQVSASSTNGTIPGLNEKPVEPSKPTLPAGFVVPPRLVFNDTQGGFTASTGNNLLFVSSGASGTNPPTRIEAAAAPADAALDPQTINSPLAANDSRVVRERVDIFSVDPDVILFPSFTGFVGQSITVNTPTVDLNQYAPLDRFIFLALQDMRVAADLTISASQIPTVEMLAGAGHSVLVDSGKTLTVDSPSLLINSPAGFTLSGSTVRKLNNTGALDITSGGPVALNNSFVSGGNVRLASGGAFSATGTSHNSGGITGASAVTLSSGTGSTIGVDVTGSGPASFVSIANSSGLLTVNNGALITGGFVTMTSPGGITLNGISETGSSLNISGGSFGGSPVAIQNSSFDLSGTFSLQNSGNGLTIGGSHISAASILANSTSAAAFDTDTITATGQATLSSGGDMTLSDTPVTGNSVRVTSGGTLTASRSAAANGLIKGNSSVTLNAGSGLTLGVDVTAGSLNSFNSSGTLTVSPGVTVQANVASLNSPGGILVDGATLSGGQATLGGSSGSGSGAVTVRNATVNLTGPLNANSRGGVTFDTDTVHAGSTTLSAGDSSFNPSPGAGPVRVTKSTFDLTGAMSIQNNSGTLVVDNASRVTAAGAVTVNSRDGATFDNVTIGGSQVSVNSGNDNLTAGVTAQNSAFTSSGGVNVTANAVGLNNASVTAAGDLNVQSGSVTLNNTVLAGDRVIVSSDGFISAPNVAPNNGSITGNSEVDLTAQSGGMTIAVDVSANTTSGTINLNNNGGILNAGGGKVFRAAFVNVSSPGGLLFDGTTVNSGTRVNMTAGSQPGTLAVVQNTSFTGAADVNIAGHTVVLNQVNFASGSVVGLSSALGQLAPSPNTGKQVQNGFVNYIQNVNYGGQPAQDFTGPGKPITIRTLP